MKITSTSMKRSSENHVTIEYHLEDARSFSIGWCNIHPETGETDTAYDYDMSAKSDDEGLAELATEALEIGEDSELYLQIREIATDQEIAEHCKVTSVCVAEYDESESIDDATITVFYSTGDHVDVQLSGGEHKSSLGCLVFLNNTEHGCDDCEQNKFMVDNAVKLAEKFVMEESEKLYETHELPFNCAMNSTSFYLRVNNETDEAQIITENHYNNELSANHRVLKTYENENQAWKEIDSYRTGEHHDFKGLNALLVAIEPSI